MPNPFTNWLSKVRNYIFPKATVEREFDVVPAVSVEMEKNINLWYNMYVDEPPWKTPEVVPLGLPSAICREIARPALSEYKATITGGARADYLSERFDVAAEKFLQNLELGLAVGGMAFRPYISNDELYVDATSAAAFQPTRFTSAGKCVGGVFREKAKVGNSYYVRLEYHDLDGTTYAIRNKAYKSDSNGSVGEEVNLAVVPDWAMLQPEVYIDNLESPLFAYFEVPRNNNVETDSYIGMSIYGGSVVDLICRADRHWDLIRWEYESAQRKIMVDVTEHDIKQFDRRLFEIARFTRDGNFYQEFSPQIRDTSLYNGFQTILKQIEFQVGMSYGTISDPQSIEKTATEIRNSKQRMYVTINSIQKNLEHAFNDLIKAMDELATLYTLAPVGEYEVIHDWGDSILDDEDSKATERANDRQDLSANIMNAWEYRAKWYSEDEETAKKMLPKMQDMVDEEENEIE